MKNLAGDPEAGRGMGVEIVSLSWRQACSNSAITSSAGRTATLPNTTFLSLLFCDMARGEGCWAILDVKPLGMKGNSSLPNRVFSS